MQKSDLIYGLISLFIALIIASIALVVTQRQMIYHPQRYPTSFQTPKSLIPIHYSVDKYPQTAFLVNKSSQPTTLLLFLSGNAALSLQWLPLINLINTSQCSFLLIDYPGYGLNRGAPSQVTIRQGVIRAVNEVKKQYPSIQNIHIIGQSLGAAVAVDSAKHLNPSSLILISPFTSLYDMAVIVIGHWWAQLLYPFLWDRYQTEVTLSQIQTLIPNINVTILHGTKDRVVPISMGKSLAVKNNWIEFVPITGMGHDINELGLQHIVSRITNRCKS